MGMINAVAIIGFLIMLAMYFPISGYLRNRMAVVEQSGAAVRARNNQKRKNVARNKGSRNQTQVNLDNPQDRMIGLTVFVAVMVVAFLLRVIIGGVYHGHEQDMSCFIAWADMVYNDGFHKFYTTMTEGYPPGYIYILYVIGWLRHIFSIPWNSAMSDILTKMPNILTDLGMGYLIYKVASEKFRETGAALLSAVYLFCPAIILDSVVWGQTDSIYVVFLAWMFYLIAKKKLIPSYFLFALAILLKPQAMMFAPVLLYGIIDHVFLKDFNWKKFGINLGMGLVAILCMVIAVLPYGLQKVISLYTNTVGSFEYASVNAYNFWTLVGKNWISQGDRGFGLSYQTWGTIFILLIVIATAFVNFRCKKTEAKYTYIGGMLIIGIFMFSVRMHERYMYPAMAFMLLAYVMKPRRDVFILYCLSAMHFFYNVAHVLFKYDAANYDWHSPILFAISLLGMVVFAFMVYTTIRHYTRYETEQEEKQIISCETTVKKVSAEEKNKSLIRPSSKLVKMTKQDYIAMGIITLIYAVIAFVHLGSLKAPETEYSVVTQGAVVADMGQDVSLGKMAEYLGYQNNPKYLVDYSSDGTNWNTLYGADNPWDAGSVFCWNYTDLNVTARYVRISPAADTTNDSIMELVFTDTEGNVVTPVNAGDYSTLFDEQDLYAARATNLNGTYFDEIYHGRTAYEMIHKLYCYENTHPPLGKELIALGVLIFGMCPFGWRFMGTLFGVLMVPIIYNFSKKFFKETWISIVTTILFTFDFMHFVQTRISTIDVYVTLFIMLSYFFMYCYTRLSFFDTKLSKTLIPLGLCGFAMGLSWASKWTGIYSAIGLAIIFFAQMIQRFREYIYATKNPNGKTGEISHQFIIKNFHKKLIVTLLSCCIFFIVVPAVIYVLSYIPFNDGTDRTLIQKVIEAQKTMFNYHSTLNATHPYGSKWYQWPIMYRPIWYYSGVVSDTVREGISAFGNPLVWWAGIPAFVYMLYLVFAKKDRKAAFLSVGYLSQYAPWFKVTRVVFIYHYFPSVPFVTVMVGYSMYRLVKKYPKAKKYAYIYAALAVGLFAMFYPVLSGTPTTVHYVKTYLKWFESWVLLQTW